MMFYRDTELSRRIAFKRNEREQRLEKLTKYSTPLTSSQSQLLELNVEQACDLVRKGEIDPSDLLTAYSKQALGAHKDTNCLTEIAIDDAEVWSKHCNKKGPLAGFPISLKDNFGLAGYDASMGYAKNTQSPITEDSPLVKLLKDAGAVPYVKTNVPVGLFSIEAYNDVWGYTVNPHNSQFCPGGSSSGEAALIARGGSRIGIGTDIGGSVRVPAHFCGIYSIRMSFNRFPRSNKDSPTPGFEGVPDVASPMARTMADLKYFIQSVMGMKPWNYCYQLTPLPWKPVELPSGCKVGILRYDNFLQITPAVSRALDIAAKSLKTFGGCEIVDFELPRTGVEYDQITASLFGADGNELYARPFLRGERVDPVAKSVLDYVKIPKIFRRIYEWILRSIFGQVSKAKVLSSLGTGSIASYFDANAQREYAREEFRKHWDKSGIDFLVLPVYPTPALPKQYDPPVATVQYTALFNLMDYPAGVVPVTTVDRTLDQLTESTNIEAMNEMSKVCFSAYDASTMHGLPVAVQVVARRYEDEKVIAAMELLDKCNHKRLLSI